MKIVWSLPVRGAGLGSTRGDLVRAGSLIEALRQDGHEVRVVEDSARPGARAVVGGYRKVLRHLLPQRPVLVLRDVGRWLHARGQGRRVAAVARRWQADLIIETEVHLAGSGAMAADATGLPLVVDDCSPLFEERLLGVGLPGLLRRVLLRQIEAASLVTVSSQALRERLAAEGIPVDKVRVVPGGVDVNSYPAVDRQSLRARLGLPAGCLVVFAGSFQPWHRVELLVAALARLGQRCDVRLLLIGEGAALRDCLLLAERLQVSERIVVAGSLPHSALPGWLAACDIGAVPGSNDYGCPMKLLEYAAAGLPSIAPDLPPVREVVEAGITGVLFPAGDLGGLVSALEHLVRSPALRETLGARARRRIMDGGSWRQRARGLVAGIGDPGIAGSGPGSG